MARGEKLGAEVKSQSAGFTKRIGYSKVYAKVAITVIETGYFHGEDLRLGGAIRMAPR